MDVSYCSLVCWNTKFCCHIDTIRRFIVALVTHLQMVSIAWTIDIIDRKLIKYIFRYFGILSTGNSAWFFTFQIVVAGADDAFQRRRHHCSI